ncbi:unnamed protein product, partial [Linum tenue]
MQQQQQHCSSTSTRTRNPMASCSLDSPKFAIGCRNFGHQTQIEIEIAIGCRNFGAVHERNMVSVVSPRFYAIVSHSFSCY